jgi:hypothetical protein
VCSSDLFNRSLKKSERRFVPEGIVRNTHAAVSRTFPKAVSDGLFDKFNLWDTSSRSGPVKIAEGFGDSITIVNNDAYTSFIEKGVPQE